MQAAIYDAPGTPNLLKIKDVPDAVARNHELLVRFEAISIEGGDLTARRETTSSLPAKTIGYFDTIFGTIPAYTQLARTEIAIDYLTQHSKPIVLV